MLNLQLIWQHFVAFAVLPLKVSLNLRKMRRYSTFKYWVYLLSLFLMTGCDFSSLDDPIVITEVDDEFTVDIWETLAPTKEGRNLLVKIESIKTENCLNYRIDYQFNQDGNRLKVALNNIVKPLDCVTGEATVKADINTGYLLNGIYSFNIDLKNTILNNGQLTILGDSYTLDMYSENGFSLKRKELLRVPTSAIWGYVTFQKASDEALANQFIEALQSKSHNPSSYRPGYYGYFDIAAIDRKVTVHEQPATANMKTFLYDYTDDAGKLKELVNRYRQDYGNQLTIKLYNAQGETI